MIKAAPIDVWSITAKLNGALKKLWLRFVTTSASKLACSLL